MKLLVFFASLLWFAGMNAQQLLPSCRHRQMNDVAKVSALNSRSDTIDITHYNVDLDITDFVTKIIKGSCEISFKSKVNGVNELPLDLLRLTVDSVKQNNSMLAFSYNDTLLRVAIPTLNAGDSAKVRVYYRGVPQGDASGWGGFYFQGGYAFNLGVGFDADPHNYGRVWHPCFDNFVERATYRFAITTTGGKIAYCNGSLINDTTIGTLRTRTWYMNDEIPTYLASVAVASYTQVTSAYNGIQRQIPVVLAALPGDTNNLKNSFINLHNAMSAFENAYGPYVWDRVGYCLVPFSSGAMEHASNIAYPRVAANGTLGYEADLMAHELAHQWWGDQATCTTAEDMWLNEGWATYSQHIFTEAVYGRQAYKAAVRSNHEEVLHYTHLKEGGYRAVSGLPHQYTYSDHVYLKGADVAHTLRGYMGDSLFFKGIKAYMTNYKFRDAGSADFRNVLMDSTGINLTDFFNNWVFNPGFPHFSVDSFASVQNGASYDVTVYVKQKLTGTTMLYSNVPLQLTFIDPLFNELIKHIIVNGITSSYTFSLPFNPSYAGLNLDEKINDATAPEMKFIKAIGTVNFPNARMSLTVRNVTDSVFVKIDHNYTSPDPFKVNTGQFRLSPNRYWKVDGVFNAGFDASARLYYDGRNIQSGGNGSLDNQLITTSEDSLVLLYRKDASDDWEMFPHYTKNVLTNLNDKYGFVTVDTLKKGEYVFGMLRYPLEMITSDEGLSELKFYPNPGSEQFRYELPVSFKDDIVLVKIYDSTGRLIIEKYAKPSESIDMKAASKGVYYIEVRAGSKAFTNTWIKH